LESETGLLTVIVAADRRQAVIDAITRQRPDWLTGHNVMGTFKGQDLLDAKVTYRHPLRDGEICPVVPAEYVTLEDGTGLVHTSPGHGLDDYHTGLAHGLDIYCPVTEDGTFDETTPDWLQGVDVWTANGLIIERLKTLHTLLADEPFEHSYPHDWRSKTPTIFRATEQWFIAVDEPLAEGGKSLRQMATELCNLDEKQGVRFIPGWGRNRIVGMLESRPDWCLSRQRSWGLPIPAFYNSHGHSLLTANSVRAVIKVLAKEGSDAWFTKTPAELLADYDPDSDPQLDDPGEFPLDHLAPGHDIFDVWFESGSSWFAAAVGRELVDEVPVDLYLEGSDQHRGWFQLSLLPALGAEARPPYKTVLTHGFVVTEDGHKMSKSLGNAIDVIDQLNTRGADILRLWVASQNYQDDIRCSEALIAQAEDAYRKIRNTLRFCMGSCSDFDPAKHATKPADHSIDLWMRLQLHELIRDVRAAYDNYEFHRATRLMYEFCTVQASSVYMAAVKDRLYCESPNAVRRRATQTVMHETLVALVKLLAPILPHTCEEAWEHIPFRDVAEPHSVHLAVLPEVDNDILRFAEDLRPVAPDAGTCMSDQLQVGALWIWDQLLDLRSAGLVKLEELRNAGVKNPLDTEAVFTVPEGNEGVRQFLELYHKELEDMLGVGFTRIETGNVPEGQIAGVDVVDTRKTYQRCARSWKRRPDVGSDPGHPDLCARDAAVVSELESAEE
ncbi:MAG: class I tRNA ligase family protein, partial [Planctomycetota bacterium]|jgi:isoleucyl-tRNA synthetase